MTVRLTQIDGKLPNLALMKLAAHYRGRGEDVVFSKQVHRDFLEPTYSQVYGSAVFSVSAPRVAEFRNSFPSAVVGGTWNIADVTTVEGHLGIPDNEVYDYSIYPDFEASIGFTQRGCRLKCGFCVVPKKEGRPRSVNTIASIWRGAPHPKHIHLLDNDFFGQPREEWEARIEEMRSGGFKVCFNQGVNIRTIDADAAKALASIPIRDDQFKTRRLYTAWDNIGDEERFFTGVNILVDAGIASTCLLAYMLVGYDKRETWERIWHRFNRMVERGIRPYPMVYDHERKDLKRFQRWVVTGLYRAVRFEDYDASIKTTRGPRLGAGTGDLFAETPV